MPTYIVGDIHISDHASYQAHLPRALATIARFGGRVVAGGGKIDLPVSRRLSDLRTPDAVNESFSADAEKLSCEITLGSPAQN